MSDTDSRKILILGATGMLGHTMLRFFGTTPGWNVVGTTRTSALLKALPGGLAALNARIIPGIDVENFDTLLRLFTEERPDVVVNCIGLVKQRAEATQALAAIPINALLPHRLAYLAEAVGARLIHISTDCVFAGTRGLYSENDTPDATDLYGRSKLLGEVYYRHSITLRTSIIGPELGSPQGLVGWFLSQQGRVQGYNRAIFSGLPTVELARVIRDHVLPHPELAGLRNVSAAPINKFDLLHLIRDTYGKMIEIEPDGKLEIDRSLDSSLLRGETGWHPPDWPELIRRMHEFG